MKQVTAYQVGEQVFPTIKEAQQNELAALFDKKDGPDSGHTALFCAGYVLDHSDEVVAILTCQPKAKAPRKPRSDLGKKRKPKDAPTLPV